MYSKDWQPRTNEVLSAIHERNNVYDRYAIAAQKRLPGTVRTVYDRALAEGNLEDYQVYHSLWSHCNCQSY